MQKLTIQNSTIQFLVFVSEQGGNTVDIAFQDDDLWATEKVCAFFAHTTTTSDFDRFMLLEENLKQ